MHRRLDVLREDYFPAYVVWELTLRCDQACAHCGSRAGRARPDELSAAEAVRVAGELADLGAREVVLIGGEAYLHDGFVDVIATLAGRGVVAAMVTGGRGVTDALARAAAGAGLVSASVSVDGLQRAHDRLRSRGSFASASAALERLRAAGITTGANTSLSRVNRGDLEGLYQHLRGLGISGWQLQLTAPLGRAADRAHMILQPWDLLDLLPRIAALKQRGFAEGVRVQPGNNLGYFGPEEALLRSFEAGGCDHWAGCQAGRFVLGIESSGAVKACLSLQSAAYTGGSLRERPLAELWRSSRTLGFARERNVDRLWGFCRTCPYATVCLAGCSFTAHAILGRPGNNPYCHHRARAFAREGRRERLVPATPPPGKPFDHGVFDIVIEDLAAADPDAALAPDAVIARHGDPACPQQT